MRPYLAQQGVPDGAAPDEVADLLRPALPARAAGEPVLAQAIAVALPDEDSLDPAARQLVALSYALATHGQDLPHG